MKILQLQVIIISVIEFTNKSVYIGWSIATTRERGREREGGAGREEGKGGERERGRGRERGGGTEIKVLETFKLTC